MVLQETGCPTDMSPKLSAGENLGHDICYRYKTKGIGIGWRSKVRNWFWFSAK